MSDPRAEIRAEIDFRLDWLTREATVTAARYESAAECGAALAATVHRYIEDPHSTGLNELQAAYSKFMSEHAGNFSSQLEMPVT